MSYHMASLGLPNSKVAATHSTEHVRHEQRQKDEAAGQARRPEADRALRRRVGTDACAVVLPVRRRRRSPPGTVAISSVCGVG
jgi:hypothetical protein